MRGVPESGYWRDPNRKIVETNLGKGRVAPQV